MSCLVSVRQDTERSLGQRRGVRREGQLQHRYPWCPLSSILTGFLTPGHLACKSQSAPLLSLVFSPTCNLPGSQPSSTSIAATRECLHTHLGCARTCICPNKQKKPGLACSTREYRIQPPNPPGEGRLGRWDGAMRPWSSHSLGVVCA